MCQLYRTLIRLHNKPIAVSLATSLSQGPSVAVKAVTSSEKNEPTKEDCLLRFLLSDEQRAFGNHFVAMQFSAHMDVDSVTAANFYVSWYSYVMQLSSGITQRDMTEEEKRMLSDEQKGRLEDLRQGVQAMRNKSDKPPPLV